MATLGVRFIKRDKGWKKETWVMSWSGVGPWLLPVTWQRARAQQARRCCAVPRPVSVDRDVSVCVCLPAPATSRLDVIIYATSSQLTALFSLSLSLSLSQCVPLPSGPAIRWCQGYQFLKRLCWCCSPGGVDDRGHTCIKQACGTHAGRQPRHLSVKRQLY